MNGSKGKFSRGGLFFIGFFTGILAAVLIGLGIVSYVLRNPGRVAGKMVDMGVKRVVVNTMKTVPADYMNRRETEIVSAAQRFARAFSQNKIPPEKISELAGLGFAIMADQEITTKEIDDVINAVNRAAGP